MSRDSSTCARQTPQSPSHRSCHHAVSQQPFDARYFTRVTNTKGARTRPSALCTRLLRPHLAFLSACITPKRFPSVSWQYAKYPTPGIGVFGIRPVHCRSLEASKKLKKSAAMRVDPLAVLRYE